MMTFPRGEQQGEPVSLRELRTGVLALSSSSFLQQIWREGWKRAGLEMGGWGTDFRRFPDSDQSSVVGMKWRGWCYHQHTTGLAEERSKRLCQCWEGCVCVSVVRRKEQVKQQNVGDGSHLWIVERTWHDNCFCFSLAVGWWTSHFRFLSLIFLIYKIRVITYLPGLLHINGPCGKQRPL